MNRWLIASTLLGTLGWCVGVLTLHEHFAQLMVIPIMGPMFYWKWKQWKQLP